LLRATDRLLSGVLKVASEFLLPTAQLIGPRKYKYAFIPHEGGYENALPAIEEFNNPIYAAQKDFLEAESMPDYRHKPEVLKPDGGFLSVSGGVTFSRLKPAEDRDGMILRLYNPSDEERSVTVKAQDGFILSKAALTKLDESAAETLELADNAVTVTAAAKKIITLKLHIAFS
ncbi:MAG: glycosyl hydrolase-related protein, partial [Clostridiales bacterium]|nr:glycosyl hydrolase-related protein [Clostridiales bacterium]